MWTLDLRMILGSGNMQELKEMERDYDQQLHKLWELENSQDKNRKAYRKIEQEETDFDAVNRELYMMMNDMTGHWRGDAYFRELGVFQEDVAESSRDIWESLARQKDELDGQIKELSRKEEDCREELRRIKLRIEEE